MEFDLSRLGSWTEETKFEVTADLVTAYAVATNDTNIHHLQAELAPPVFAVVPTLMEGVTEALWSVAISEYEGYDTRSVHGEQDLLLNGPLVPGMVVSSRAATIGVHRKSSGTIVVIKTETRNETRELLNVQYCVNFIRGVFVEESAGELPPRRDLLTSQDGTNPVAAVILHVDRDQAQRYAEASGDFGSYHLDEKAALAAGHPGIILHGLCSMAFASRAVIQTGCEEEPDRLKRLAVRFTKPVVLNQDITTTIWSAGSNAGRDVYRFETTDATGDLVLSHGLAEVET